MAFHHLHMRYFQQLTLVTALVINPALSFLEGSVNSRLQVQIPKNLFRTDGYKHKEALFGLPPYGGSISQSLYYTESLLCEDVKPILIPKREEKDTSPFILMVDRGDCTFVQKARNAQHAGAAALLIADTLCLCSETNCTTEKGDIANYFCESFEPVMADDGSAGDVTIPSMLLYKPDADELREEIKKESAYMKIEMTWNIPNPDNRVEDDLWTVPYETVSKDFQKGWKNIADKLGDRVRFKPHQYIFDGSEQCTEHPERCESLCTNNNRYCSNDPDGYRTVGISGADVVRESLRRICAWKDYGEDDGIGLKYWDYIQEFNYRCFAVDDDDFKLADFFSQDCINDVYKNANIDGDMIEKCMTDSGGTDDANDTINNLLEKELAEQKQFSISVLPIMDVNNIAIRGRFDSSTIFAAICAGFVAGSEPDICKLCAGCLEIKSCIVNEFCPEESLVVGNDYYKGTKSPSGVSSTTFGLTVLFIFAVFAGVGFLHWKKTQTQMKDQVKAILAEYMPLESNQAVGTYNSPDQAANGIDSPMELENQAKSSSLIT